MSLVQINKGYWYNFPKMKGIEEESFGLHEQISKIEEEIRELHNAHIDEDDSAMLMECMDVIVSCETLLRFFDTEFVDAALAMVMAKNRARGYWDEGEDDPVAETPEEFTEEYAVLKPLNDRRANG